MAKVWIRYHGIYTGNEQSKILEELKQLGPGVYDVTRNEHQVIVIKEREKELVYILPDNERPANA